MVALLNLLLVIGLQLLLLLSCSGLGQEDKKLNEAMAKAAKDQGIDPDNLKPGEMYMVPPVLTDEEEGSRQMPRVHRCSGCKAAAFQFQKGFATAEKKLRKGLRLPYSDVLEVAETVCEKKMGGYGVKNVKGKKYLSGEGLEHDKEMGMMEAGGKWEVRLKTLCEELIELYEEEEIYEKFVKRGENDLSDTLCSNYCSLEEIKEGKDEL
uniref:DUF3456 domain-containing protein n=1 Tax=Arion vulgaris TaxID=1028688 RepID=A0A0B6YM38_9EUPU